MKQPSKKELDIMRRLARRNQTQEIRGMQRVSVLAKQKAANLSNQLNTLTHSPYYTSAQDAATRNKMINQIKGELSKTLGDIIPTRPPLTYR